MQIDGWMALLVADATVNGMVNGRVYENELPRGYTLPAVAVHQYNGLQDYEYAGPVGVREDQVQFDTYGNSGLSARQVAEAIRSLMVGYTGTLPDGTVIQGCYLEREMAMPFLPHADQKGIANRFLIGFRVVSARV